MASTGRGLGKERFEQWYSDDWPNLVLFAVRLGASQQHAQDLVQDAAAEAFARRSSIFEPRGYARVSIRNAYFKTTARTVRESGDAPPDDLPAPEDLSMGAIEFADQERLVFAAIRRLPLGQREAVAFSIDGYKPAEIAELLGTTHGAIRARLFEARARLRVELQPLLGGED